MIETWDAREHEALPLHTVRAGATKAKLESADEPVVHKLDAGPMQIDANIGTEAKLTCILYEKPIDGAGQLAAIIRNAAKAVDLRLVLPREIVAVGEHPLVFVDAAYTVKGEPTKGGIFKVVAFPHPTTPAVCMHDELGYHETFKRIVMGFASSLSHPEAPKPSRFAELQVEKQDGHATGFSHMEVTDDTDGARVYQSISATFTLRSPTELDGVDAVRSERWERDGSISIVTYVEGEGGDISENMTLRHTTGAEYTYEGTHLGKKISGKFKTQAPGGFLTDERVATAVKRLAEGAELHVDVYHPNVDPTAPLDEIIHRVPHAERRFTVDFGKLHMTTTCDAEGRMDSASLALGTTTMTFERAFIRGAY